MPRKVTVANKKIALVTKALGFKNKKLAEWTGLEPATLGVTGRYSNQLNYHSGSLACARCLVGAKRFELLTYAL